MRLHFALPLVLAVGCAHQPKPVAKTPTQARAEETPPPAPPPVATTGGCQSDLDCGKGRICLDAACVDVNDPKAACFHVAHFEFDQADVRADDRDGLERVARCLKAAPDLFVDVDGHTDERGTTEYNLALGDRRAHAVVAYLASLGAPTDRVRAVSYGKLRPICEAHDEPCWGRNRRADVHKMSDTARRDFEERRAR